MDGAPQCKIRGLRAATIWPASSAGDSCEARKRYFLRQITASQANGRAVAGSQEQVAALGPGFLVGIGALQLGMNAYGEFAVENRPQGTRVTAVAIGGW